MEKLKYTLIGRIIVGFIMITLSLSFMGIELTDNPFSYIIDMMGIIGIVSGSANIVKSIID